MSLHSRLLQFGIFEQLSSATVLSYPLGYALGLLIVLLWE